MDGAQVRAGLLHQGGNPQAEIRAVDGYKHIRLESLHSPNGLAHAPEDGRQTPDDRTKAHHRDIRERKEARDPFFRHARATHGREFD